MPNILLENAIELLDEFLMPEVRENSDHHQTRMAFSLLPIVQAHQRNLRHVQMDAYVAFRRPCLFRFRDAARSLSDHTEEQDVQRWQTWWVIVVTAWDRESRTRSRDANGIRCLLDGFDRSFDNPIAARIR